MEINRRGLLLGLASVMAAPAIVRASNLMPVKSIMEKHWIMRGYDEYGRGITEIIELPLSYPKLHYGDMMFLKLPHWPVVVYLGRYNPDGLRLRLRPRVWNSHTDHGPSYGGMEPISDGIPLRSMAHPQP